MSLRSNFGLATALCGGNLDKLIDGRESGQMIRFRSLLAYSERTFLQRPLARESMRICGAPMAKRPNWAACRSSIGERGRLGIIRPKFPG